MHGLCSILLRLGACHPFQAVVSPQDKDQSAWRNSRGIRINIQSPSGDYNSTLEYSHSARKGKVAITKSESVSSVSVLTINRSEHPGIENEQNIVLSSKKA